MKTFTNLAHRAFKKCASLGTANRNRYYLFTIIMLLTLGVGNAWGAEVTFDPASDKTFPKDGVTLSLTDGTLTNGTDYRVYKNQTMTISSANGTITNIALTYKSASYDGGGWATSYQPNADSWTSPTASGEQARITKIVVTYTPSGGSETPEPDPEPDPTPDPGTGTTGTLVITRESFPSGSLAYNTTDNWSATASTGETVSGQGDLYSTSNQTTMQTKNSSVSTHYHNTTAMPGAISKISVEVASGTDRSYTVYASTTAITSTTGLTSLGSLKGTTPIEIDPTKDYKYFWLQCTGGASYLNNITITYNIESSGGGEPETPATELANDQFAWSAATAEATIGASNTFPTLTNTLPVSVTYESSNTAAATIAADGTITLVAPGATTISAKFAGGEVSGTTYAAKTVNYALTVLKAPATPTENVYVKVTDAVTDGEYLIVYEDGKVAFNGALTTLDAVSNTVEVIINSNTIAGNTDIDAATFTINVTDGTILSASGYYIGQTSDANGLKANTTTQYENVLTIENDGTATIKSSGAYLRYNSDANNWRFRYYKSSSYSGQKAIALYKKVDPNAVVEPVFTLAAGEYYGTQSVEITCTTAGAEVYYTLDGTDPTSTPTKYTGAISIASTTTIKAVAIKGENSSAVVSATYTILAPLATMQEIFDKATAVGSTATPVHITMNNWVVTGVKGSNAYVTDGTKGLIIYKSSHGFVVGDVLSGTVACEVQLHNGSAELAELTSSTSGLNVTKDGVVTPVVVNDVTTLGGVNTGSVIKITGPCTVDGTKYYVAGVQLYNSLYTYTNPEDGYNYECTGVYLQYNTTKEILPRKAEDLVKIETQQPAGISFAVTELTAEVGATEFAEPTLTNPNSLTVTYKTSDETLATVNATTGEVTIGNKAGKVTITASFAGSDDYVAANVSYNITITDPSISEATFVAGTDKSDTKSISKNGITVEFADGSLSRDDNYRCYAGKSMTISYDDGNITKIVIECTANDGAEYGPGQFTTETATYSYSGKVGTWTGEANSVTFTNIKQVRMTTITVYYKQDKRANAELAWNPATVSLTVGDAFTVPTFSNPNSLTVNFKSSNADLATVNNSGVISLVSGKTGTATITATYAGDKDYKAAEVTCVITVSPKTENVVILAQHAGNWYALMAQGAVIDGVTKADRLAALPVEYFNGTLYNVTEADKALITWERVVTENKATFKNGTNYLVGSTSTTLSLDATAFDWAHNGETYLSDEDTRTFLYHKDGIFRNYGITNASDGIDEDKAYSALPVVTAAKFETATFYTRSELTVGNYGTICLPYAVNNYTGATFYKVAGKEDNKIVFDEVTELEAGKPYIFMAEATEIKLAQVGEEYTGSAQLYNSLQGTFTQIDPAEDNILVGNYMVVNNIIKKCGINCGLKANRAYFVADELEKSLGAPTASQAPDRRRISLNVTSENTTTGLDNITNGENTTIKVIENGQLVIIRNGEKFNAQGQKL